jgi:hypothetical protein
MRPFPLAVFSLCLALIGASAGCGGLSAREALADAKTALADGRYDDALAAADAGLSLGADEVTAWGLELAKLEAFARAGRGDDTVAQLEALAQQRPEQVPADQYAASADQLRAAGAGEAAIQVLDGGLGRFPDDAALLAQLDAVKQAAAPGSDELEMLRSLGYVE